MATDIYTKTPIDDPSEEHMLLSALGGSLKSLDLVARSTNNKLGHTIDAALMRAVQFLRLIFDARSVDGNAAAPLKGLRGGDGKKYGLLSGGKPELGQPTATFTKKEDGSVQVHAEVRTLEEAEKLLRRKLEGLGADAKSMVETLHKRKSVPVPPLEVSLAFGPDEYRCIAKMACNLLAYNRSRIFLDAGFDGIRSFVFEGVGDPVHFVWLNPIVFDLACSNPIGQVDHLLLVHGNAHGEVLGLVVLFAHLQFVVRLGTSAALSGTAHSYRVDQLSGGARIDDSSDLAIGPELFTHREFAGWDRQIALYEESLRRLLAVTTDYDFKRARTRLIQQSLDEVFREKPEVSLITPGEIDEIARVVAMRYVELLDRVGFVDDKRDDA